MTARNHTRNYTTLTDATRMMDGLSAGAAVPKTVMIDATYLKAHRTATSLRSKKGGRTTEEAV